MTHIQPKAFLFDMDDTILNYDSVADPSWRQVCETVTPGITGLETEVLFTALKTKSQWFWSDPGPVSYTHLTQPTNREV